MFERIMRDQKATPKELITGAERFAAERAGENPTFTAHAKTWLNAGRWAVTSPHRGMRRHGRTAGSRLARSKP
ncbi:hypothetical protein [Methylobacterium sp. ARG-1]|uniref:hypothetical protein n=1 Tax=Methylobacterium sp. ARG-1 TaxID=1692501 RepID=UPI000A6E010E|nr:hypothetical protein [Methylobacterium sp. ARG-1]